MYIHIISEYIQLIHTLLINIFYIFNLNKLIK